MHRKIRKRYAHAVPSRSALVGVRRRADADALLFRGALGLFIAEGVLIARCNRRNLKFGRSLALAAWPIPDGGSRPRPRVSPVTSRVSLVGVRRWTDADALLFRGSLGLFILIAICDHWNLKFGSFAAWPLAI
mmetsp:Transcript_9856/g.17496  ORF Transcript_9856/g.17496 Transcript_9856/m.17496 type:complete len:133 (-) Transcript_9856:175-573(-)